MSSSDPQPAGESPSTEACAPDTAVTAAAAAPSPSVRDLSPAACGARLAELFPALFAAASPALPGEPAAQVKPIKLRIHADIQARAPGEFSKRVLGIFFSRYTTTNAYLKALAHAPHRIDLDGQPAGDIAQEHRQAAVVELDRRRAIAIDKRAAERRAAGPGPAAADGTEAHAQPASAAHAHAQEPAQRHRNKRMAPGAPRRADARSGPRHHGDERSTGAESPNHRRPPPQQPRGPRPDAPVHARPPRQEARQAVEAVPLDPARRERALLLRAFEGSTLTKANFCALKRLTVADLDAQLDLARAERAERS